MTLPKRPLEMGKGPNNRRKWKRNLRKNPPKILSPEEYARGQVKKHGIEKAKLNETLRLKNCVKRLKQWITWAQKTGTNVEELDFYKTEFRLFERLENILREIERIEKEGT